MKPCVGIASRFAGRIFPYATTMPASGFSAAIDARNSSLRIRGGCASGNPISRAFTATAGACIFIPRPAGLSGCATTSAISCSRASASRVGTANSGVPKKTRRKWRDCKGVSPQRHKEHKGFSLCPLCLCGEKLYVCVVVVGA